MDIAPDDPRQRTWDEMNDRERDALVATEVMGWAGNMCQDYRPGPRENRGGTLSTWCLNCDHYASSHDRWPRYSTDIAAAWGVVERIRHDSLSITLAGYWEGSTGKWWVHIMENVEVVAEARADSAPEAICIAALRAKGLRSVSAEKLP